MAAAWLVAGLLGGVGMQAGATVWLVEGEAVRVSCAGDVLQVEQVRLPEGGLAVTVGCFDEEAPPAGGGQWLRVRGSTR